MVSLQPLQSPGRLTNKPVSLTILIPGNKLYQPPRNQISSGITPPSTSSPQVYVPVHKRRGWISPYQPIGPPKRSYSREELLSLSSALSFRDVKRAIGRRCPQILKEPFVFVHHEKVPTPPTPFTATTATADDDDDDQLYAAVKNERYPPRDDNKKTNWDGIAQLGGSSNIGKTKRGNGGAARFGGQAQAGFFGTTTAGSGPPRRSKFRANPGRRVVG